MNPKTGIRYGVISANDIDPDFLNDFEYIYEDMFCEECGEKLSDVICDNCETKNLEYGNNEALYSRYTQEGLVAEHNFNTNYVTVLKSRSIFKTRLCSPCYPNAGDLSSPGNYRTYGIPKKYLRDGI